MPGVPGVVVLFRSVSAGVTFPLPSDGDAAPKVGDIGPRAAEEVDSCYTFSSAQDAAAVDNLTLIGFRSSASRSSAFATLGRLRDELLIGPTTPGEKAAPASSMLGEANDAEGREK